MNHLPLPTYLPTYLLTSLIIIHIYPQLNFPLVITYILNYNRALMRLVPSPETQYATLQSTLTFTDDQDQGSLR